MQVRVSGAPEALLPVHAGPGNHDAQHQARLVSWCRSRRSLTLMANRPSRSARVHQTRSVS